MLLLHSIPTSGVRTFVRQSFRTIASPGLWAATVLLLTEMAVAQQDAPSTDVDENWQVVFIQGQRVGYAHSRLWESEEAGDKRIWSEVVTQMTIKRFGASLNMTVTQLTEEDEQGNLLSFVFEMDNPPISHSRTEGRVDGEKLLLTTTAAGQTSESTQPWDTDVKSSAYQDRLLEEDPIRPGQTRTFKVFDPQYLKIAELTLQGQEPASTTLLDGTKNMLDRVKMTHSLVPGLITTIYADTDGSTVKTEANLLQIVTYTVSRDEALKEIAGEELDLAVGTLVKVEPIKQAHQSQRIVYELTLDQPQLPVNLPTGPTQSIERIDEKTYRITVTSLRPQDDSAAPRGEEADRKPIDRKYLTSSRQLECEHPKVVELAEIAAEDQTAPTDITVAMERHVHSKLTSKNFSTNLATAGEVAQSLEGDCTEHAMLLAAMLRVKDIPSRIVVGLVYAEGHQAFGGHMWTEAHLDGRWVPLDATLGRGGIGAGHLKFAHSSLADDAPAAVSAFLPLVGLLEHMSIRVIEQD